MKTEFKEFTIKNTIIGPITIVFYNKDDLLIKEIIISNQNTNSSHIAYEKYDSIEESSYDDLDINLKDIITSIEKYLNGENVEFTLDYLDLSSFTPFQQDVLITEYNTKRGTVNTYGQLASMINRPKSYRAVGNVLSHNPYPIIIPCHRTVRKDWTIGGFNGQAYGDKSKEILLSLEGIEIKEKKVISESTIISLNKKDQTKLI
ncbi:methylated-DNA--[protein]-cysteine S-methyltransferase [Methanobrevibacter sp.]